jgi:hypothetical protein
LPIPRPDICLGCTESDTYLLGNPPQRFRPEGQRSNLAATVLSRSAPVRGRSRAARTTSR